MRNNSMILILMSLITTLFVVLSVIAGVAVWSERHTTKQYVCESNISYNDGVGIDFDVKGNSIITIIKKDTVTREFIKKNLNGSDIDTAFQTYKINAEKKFKEIAEKYKDNKQFAITYHADDNKIVTKYFIYVSNENFDPIESEKLLNELGLMGFYDEKQSAFIFDEDVILNQPPLNAIPSVTCKQK